MGNKIKNQIGNSLRTPTPQVNANHLQETVALACKEYTRKSKGERINFSTFLVRQLKYMAWKIWMVQGIILIGLCCILATSFGEFFLSSPRYVALLLCCCAMIVLMTAIPFIQRGLRYKMHEIESATKFSAVKLLMAKLLIIGIGDGVMLASVLLLTIFKTSLNISSAILYLLLPFLIVSSGCLYFLGHASANKFPVYCGSMCAMIFVTIVVLNRLYPSFLNQTFSIGWMGVCILLVIFCVHQLRYIMQHLSYAEMQFA